MVVDIFNRTYDSRTLDIKTGIKKYYIGIKLL